MSDSPKPTTDRADASPRRRGRRLLSAGWRLTKWLALAIIVLGLVYVVWTNHRGARAVAHLRQAAADRGMRADVTEWRSRYHGQPDEQRDGTGYYRAAAALYAPASDRTDHLPVVGTAEGPMPTSRIAPDTAADVAGFIAAHEQVFVLLDAAGDYDHFDFQFLDLESRGLMDISLLGDMRALARLLQLRSLHAQAIEDPGLAVQSVQATGHLSRSLEHEPTLIVELVRISIDMLTVGMVEDILGRMSLSAEHLQAVSTALQNRAAAGNLDRVLEGEMLYTVHSVAGRDRLIFETMQTRRAARQWDPDLMWSWSDDWYAWMQPHAPDALFRAGVGLCPGWLELRAVRQARDLLDEVDTLRPMTGDWPALAIR